MFHGHSIFSITCFVFKQCIFLSAVSQSSQHLDVAFEPYFLSNMSPLYKAKQHHLMKLHLKKQLLEAKLSEAKKAVQQQHLQALQHMHQAVAKSLNPSASNLNPWNVPSTPQTTPAATADTTPKHCTPSISPPMSPPNEAKNARGTAAGTSRAASAAAAAAAAAAAIGSPLIKSAWCQHLLSPPVPHEMVMERNHGGARRFVVIDFGRAVYLTDVLIPSNEQLSSLSLDVWLHYEDIDGQRLAHVTDIASRPVILCDLQSAPVCRYLKITVCSSFKVSGATNLGETGVRTDVEYNAFIFVVDVHRWRRWLSGRAFASATSTATPCRTLRR